MARRHRPTTASKVAEWWRENWRWLLALVVTVTVVTVLMSLAVAVRAPVH